MSGKSDEKKSRYMDPNRDPFRPPESIPETLVVPPETIYLVPDQFSIKYLGEFQKAPSKRDWFTNFFYFCLPLVFGNQHGFILRSTHSFVCRWDGTDEPTGLKIHLLEETPHSGLEINSHFGFGILTVQARHALRTPDGVNLMVKAPPNFPVDGFSWMDAVVETDNLRRDFTFNIKVTRADMDIYVEKGTPLGCVVPYPRYFIDRYEMKVLEDPTELEKAIKTTGYFSKERSEHDRDQPRLRYMEGKDIYDVTFKEHQKSLDGGAWWKEEKPRMDQSLRAKAAEKAGVQTEDFLKKEDSKKEKKSVKKSGKKKKKK